MNRELINQICHEGRNLVQVCKGIHKAKGKLLKILAIKAKLLKKLSGDVAELDGLDTQMLHRIETFCVSMEKLRKKMEDE